MPIVFEKQASIAAKIEALLDELETIGADAESFEAIALELKSRAIANNAQAVVAIHDLAELANKTLVRVERLARKSRATIRLVREILQRERLR